MKPNPPAAPAHPVLLAIAAAVLVADALLILTAAAVALLLAIAGWRPAPGPAAAPAPAAPMPAPALAPTAPLEACNVAQLRRMARAAGHRQLARSGRRADLLQALGGGCGPDHHLGGNYH